MLCYQSLVNFTVLYKDGPGVYHASYVVKVEVVYGRNAIETEELAAKSMSWITLMGLNRLAETSGKVCYFHQSTYPNLFCNEEILLLKKIYFRRFFCVT